MADKVDKKLSASLLPAAVEKKKKKMAPPFPAVHLVSLWALLTAGVFIASFALACALPSPSWMLPAPRTGTGLETDAGVADAEETAASIRHGVAWCTAAQSATAVLALLLPGSRRGRSRRALAYAALAAAAANHLMFARGIALLVTVTADPGRIAFWFWIIGGTASVFMLAAGDLVCFLAITGRLECAQAECAIPS